MRLLWNIFFVLLLLLGFMGYALAVSMVAISIKERVLFSLEFLFDFWVVGSVSILSRLGLVCTFGLASVGTIAGLITKRPSVGFRMSLRSWRCWLAGAALSLASAILSGQLSIS